LKRQPDEEKRKGSAAMLPERRRVPVQEYAGSKKSYTPVKRSGPPGEKKKESGEENRPATWGKTRSCKTIAVEKNC